MSDTELCAAFDAGFEAFFDPLGNHSGFGFGIGFTFWLHGLMFAGDIHDELERVAS